VRFLPLAGILILVVLALGWRPWLQRRRYGASGVLLFRSADRWQLVRDGLGVLLFLLLIGQAAAAAAWPEAIAPLWAYELSTPGLGRAAGALLLLGGVALLVAAQLDLGAAWRIGIEEGARPGLVTGGLYRFCRNPIFLALLVVIAGYAVLLPTRLSLALLVCAYLGVRRQIAAEEAYLLRTYGDSFRDYARRTGRLLPGLGELR
jgi:protein-S-isoprenylcysteine O-methyltransferase Ste14